jgi:hypothetical protein
MASAASVAFAETPKADTAAEQTEVADLPVCGQPAATPSAGAVKATDGLAAESSTVEDRVLATLTLDQEDQETVTAATFGRSTDPQPLTLVYRVSGCRVVDTLPLPRSPLPTGPVNTVGARALPLGSVQIDDVEADGDRYVVHLRVFVSSGKASDQGGTSNPASAAGSGPTATAASAVASPPGEFSVDPGSYTSFVRVKGEWLRTVATPVTVTRSEDTESIPLGIGALGGLCGFFVFWLLRKIHEDDLMVKERWVLWFAAAASVVVGTVTAFVTNYLNQDVWTVESNALALFIAAFSASTGGVAAGLLTGIYKTSAANTAAAADTEG